MNLIDTIQNNLVEKDGVYYIKDHCFFNYSDGDEAENYIYSTIINANDISSNSRELEGKIKDWASLYHFSRERSLAYKSLELPSNASVLEVGCGCGAITRFLGENVSHVLALEGSPRRAAIARARTRDLRNVAVLCASFEDVVFDGVFDYVILNGVLEYAPLFVKHEEPAKELIRLLVALLKPSGNLIVAIENKFGLRYFSSGKEEHTDTMYDGLEGYPKFPGGPSTFGYSELHGMLKEKCSFVKCLLPLPDYKLPSAVICAELLDEVNCADLFATVTRHDFGSYEEPRMHERLVWHELHKNKLMRDFANSFLMIAGHEKTSLLKQDWLGDIYAIKRNAEAMVKTTISRQEDGTIQTGKSYLQRDTAGGDKQAVGHVLERSSWIDGVSIYTMVVRAMLRHQTSISLEERLSVPVAAWWEGVLAFRTKEGALRDEALDCIWQNAILCSGKVHFIDKEWVSRKPIEPMIVIFRTVTNFAAQEKFYYRRWDASCKNINEMSLLRAVANIVHVEITFRSLLKAMADYLDVLETVYGGPSAGFKRSCRLLSMYLNLLVPFRWMKIKEKVARRVTSLGGRVLRKVGIAAC